jgi:DNA-binding transcriptional MerR regulator
MYIGELAKKAAIHIQTIRFYERVRLLPKPARTLAGYRNYTTADLERVIFIRWCQKLGFTLKEIRQLVQLHNAVVHLPSRGNGKNSNELRLIIRMAQDKIQAIEEKMNDLKSIQCQIIQALKELQRRSGPVCPASRDSKTASADLGVKGLLREKA